VPSIVALGTVASSAVISAPGSSREDHSNREVMATGWSKARLSGEPKRLQDVALIWRFRCPIRTFVPGSRNVSVRDRLLSLSRGTPIASAPPLLPLKPPKLGTGSKTGEDHGDMKTTGTGSETPKPCSGGSGGIYKRIQRSESLCLGDGAFCPKCLRMTVKTGLNLKR